VEAAKRDGLLLLLVQSRSPIEVVGDFRFDPSSRLLASRSSQAQEAGERPSPLLLHSLAERRSCRR
jgi:hypothetical protein